MTTKVNKSEDPYDVWPGIEPNVPEPEPDFEVRDEGTVFLLSPLTPSANEWIEENLPDDATWFGCGIVVEHRYIRDILIGINKDGLLFKSV